MAIFRGTGGSGNSTDDSIVSAVTQKAAEAEGFRDEAEGFKDQAEGFKNTASTSATTATTKAGEASNSADTASDKATEANTAKGLAEDAQTAAESARDTAQIHANTANNSSVQTVAGISTEVQNLDSIKTDITGVNTIKSDVTTVAGISSNVTTVAADASDIGTVATNIANVNSVGDNISNVNSVAGNATNINTVAADGTDIGTVASNISDVNTVAGISSNVTTVAGLESKMDTVIADASDIGAVAGNISDVSTVAGINADVDTVAGISAKVTTVADNISDVQNADTNAANASASASQAANSATAAGTSATTASTKATEASNSATAASNSATTATTKATEAAGSATTATTKASEASTSATNAATSATTATTKASEAASSATAASGSATTATTKASEADVSANSAASSATDATNASNTWSNFYTTYLGAADAPPTVDVQGNALQTGAFYYDTGAGSNTVGLYVYNGSTWVYSTNYNNVTAPYILAQDLNANGNDIISVGKVGIGTSSPQKLFEVSSNSSPTVRISNTRNDTLWDTDPVFGALEFYSHDGSGSGASVRSKIQAEAFTEYGNATDLVFYSGDALGVANEGMRLSYTGRLGIGADEPNNRLHIKHSDNELARFESTDPAVLISLKDNTATSRIQNLAGKLSLQADTGSEGADSRIDFKVDGSEKMRIKTNGNVGIGTTSPSEALEVNGKVKADTHFTSSDGAVTLSTSGNGGAVYLRPNGNSQSSGQVIVNSSGNVGIGTTSPSEKLHIVGGDLGIGSTQYRENNIVSYANADYAVATSGAYNLTFKTNDTERMRIDSSGDVLIGGTQKQSPSGIDKGLFIQSQTNGDVVGVNLYSNELSNNRRADFFLDDTNGIYGVQSTASTGLPDFVIKSGSNERFRVTNSGNVGIGTATPAYPLQVNGNVRSHRMLTDDGTASLPSFTFGGDANTGMFTPSDDALAWSTGGSERMRIASNGKVGIGNTGPQAGLHITQDNTQLILAGAAGTNDKFIAFDVDLDTDVDTQFITVDQADALAFGEKLNDNDRVIENEWMRIDASGNVGIGTNSPATTLTVAGSYANGIELDRNGADATSSARLFFDSSSGGTAIYNHQGNTLFSTGATASSSSGTERMRIDSSGNVGIGTNAPAQALHVYHATDNQVATLESGDSTSALKIKDNTDETLVQNIGGIQQFVSNNTNTGTAGTRFLHGGSEKMRIDSSGNLLVGKSSVGVTAEGIEARADGLLAVTRDGASTALFNRETSDGDIVQFRKDNTTVGSIGNATGTLVVGSTDGSGSYLRFGSNNINPVTSAGALRDAAIDLGKTGGRFKDIYRSGSTYSTSDRNKKQDIRDLTDAEARVAVVAKGSLKAFRYIDTVEAEGDDANIHFGIIAQDLKAAFEAEGLNANNYQVLKTSTHTDDDGVEQTTYSVCYENLLAFIISAI